MRGGQLDRRITIQRQATVDDPEYGPQVGGWEDVATRVPAQVADVLPSRSEAFGVAAQNAIPARVRIRFLPGLTADMRIILHGKTSPNEDTIRRISAGPAEIGRREWTEFMVEAYSNE